MPFLEYSSLFWDAHAKIELSDRGKALAIELLNQLQSHISFTFKNIWAPQSPLFLHGSTSLHCASSLGIGALVAGLIEMKNCDINQIDSVGYTPLMWAVTHGITRL